MCTNMHYIFNKYIRKRVLVPCGKCPACLQQKADIRTKKIRNHFNSEQTCLFVTLTYDNDSVPCIKDSDIQQYSFINVYRGISCTKVIDRCYVGELPYKFDPTKLPSVRSNNQFISGITGVSIYSDIQKFFKRLRIKLHRNGINTNFQYFSCTEYGETFKRPHAHLLLFVDSDKVETFRTYIHACWPFADTNRLRRSIEVAKHPADYVSGYVNCITSLPLFLQKGAFRPRHSHSVDFGKNNHTFSLASILTHADANDFEYLETNHLHFSGDVAVCFPKYVISRYFPIFKGYPRVPAGQILNVLHRPALLASVVGNFNEYSNKDVRQIGITLKNHYKRYCKDYPKSRLNGHDFPSYEDYCIDFERVWRCYNMTKLRVFYREAYNEDRENPLDCYDNCNEVVLNKVHTDLLLSHSFHEFEERANYNMLKDRVKISTDLKYKFIRKDKQRKVTNSIYAQLSEVF